MAPASFIWCFITILVAPDLLPEDFWITINLLT